jgi:Uma2 family endonuclease
LPEDGYKYEYVNGELVKHIVGMRYDRIALQFSHCIQRYLEENPVAEVCGPSTGYRMANGNLRCPDLSVVLLDRFPEGTVPEGFGYFAPDIAVEVISPSEDRIKLAEKIPEYFANGSRLVLIVDPELERVTIYCSPESSKTVDGSEVLELSQVLPGFSCHVSEIFKKRSR